MPVHGDVTLDAAQFIRDNIARHKQFALGTADENGSPWVVCLNLAYDEHYNIVWESDKNTAHSQHIKNRPEVAVCIFSETEGVGDFGLYARARAREVTGETELRKLLNIRYGMNGKPSPPLDRFLGDSPDRLYIAEVNEMWVNDDRHIKTPVDRKLL